MPLILGTNSIKDTGFDVANSLRFNDGSSDNLSFSASAGNRKTWTLSGWFKRSHIGSFQRIISSRIDGSNYNGIAFSSDKIQFSEYQGGDTINLVTSRVFRDVSSWYSIIIAVDTTQGTASNRVKFYINGVQETSFSTSTYPSENLDTVFNSSSSTHRIGTNDDNTGGYYDGYMAEFVFIDGQQLDPTSFGEFDEDTGIWKPIDVSGLTFGTNGFYLDFENSGSLGADVSGNGNNFTVNNLTSIDQSTDTCTNNFATLNPLWTQDTSLIPTLAEGNLLFSGGGGGSIYQTIGTIAFTKGKWFWECKFSTSSGLENASPGIVGIDGISGGRFDQKTPAFFWRNKDGGEYILNNSTSTNDYGTFAQNNIISFAIDMDASTPTATIYKNGSAHVSNISLTSFANKTIAPAATTYESGSYQWNFGSPPYSESGGNSDGNGYGNFSMTVPSGYYALNTKNLAEYG